MTFMSRSLPGLFLLAIVLLGFASLSAKWLVELCTPTYFDKRLSLFEELRRSEHLSREAQAVAKRTRITRMIREEVLSGEMTLFEATAWFRSLYEEPQTWLLPDYPRPGHDDGERWCRLVIEWFGKYVHYNYSPSRAEVLCRRLERELHEHLQQHGTVKLPDVTE